MAIRITRPTGDRSEERVEIVEVSEGMNTNSDGALVVFGKDRTRKHLIAQGEWIDAEDTQA